MIGALCLVLGLAGLHWVEFRVDGTTTTVTVLVDSLVALAGAGLVSASFFQSISKSIVNRVVDALVDRIDKVVAARLALICEEKGK